MKYSPGLRLCSICLVAAALAGAVAVPSAYAVEEVLRGIVRIETEPNSGNFVEQKPPIDKETAYRRALEEAAYMFAGQIYGFSFYYDIGERARGIAENFELTPAGVIKWGDPCLRVTDARVSGTSVEVWTDYRPDPMSLRRLAAWTQGQTKSISGIGFGPLGGPVKLDDWMTLKKSALQDAARAAVRAMLRGSERNRPKEARGIIALTSFPAFYFDSGRLSCRARFRVLVSEIVPFAAY